MGFIYNYCSCCGGQIVTGQDGSMWESFCVCEQMRHEEEQRQERREEERMIEEEKVKEGEEVRKKNTSRAQREKRKRREQRRIVDDAVGYIQIEEVEDERYIYIERKREGE